MNRHVSLCVLLMALAQSGCGSSIPEEEADASQADVFERLNAIDANVSLDLEGKIIGVDFESESQGDNDLALLKEIPTLKSVGLSGSGVTDDGLSTLAEISTLEYVNLEDTNISARAAQELRDALPDCRVSHGTGDDE